MLSKTAVLLLTAFVVGCACDGSSECGDQIESNYIFNSSGNIADYSKVCKIKSADINDCIKKSFEENFSNLHNPDPNPNYPFVDPFFYSKGKLYLNRTRTLRGYFAVKNMTVIGGSKARVKTVETFFNKDEMMVSVRLLLKQVNATGMYKTNVTFNDFAFISKGRFNATFTNMIADLMLEGNFMHDKHQFNVTRLEMMPTVQNMKFAITGVFKDDTSSECETAKVKNVDFFDYKSFSHSCHLRSITQQLH